MTPLVAARMSSGWTSVKAASAAALSPAASASSTLRIYVRTRDRLFLLPAARRAILRVAFLAEDVLAMMPLYPCEPRPGSNHRAQKNKRAAAGHLNQRGL